MSPTSCHCSTPHRGADYTTRTRGRQGVWSHVRTRRCQANSFCHSATADKLCVHTVAPVVSLKIRTIAQSLEPHYNRPWCEGYFFICDVCRFAFLHSSVAVRVT